MNRKTQLILALDVASRERALILADQLKDYFDAIKIGYPLKQRYYLAPHQRDSNTP